MRTGRTKWLVSATFFILTIVWLANTFVVPSGAAADIGKYRESFGNAQVELEKINVSLASLDRVNVSAIEAIRGKVTSLKSALNVSDVDAVKEAIKIESNETEVLRVEVSKLEPQNKNIFLGVFGTFGLLGGFWSAFILYTLLSAIVKR